MPWVWRTRWPHIPRLIVTSMLVGAAIYLPACGRSDQSTNGASPATAPTAAPTPSPTPINPKALLDESGRVMSDLQSFHFLLEHEEGGTPLAEGLTLIRAEGDVVKPDKISVDFSASAGGFAVRLSLISVGNVSYMTNPLNGEWSEVSQEVSPLGFFDPQRGISSIMSQVEQAVLVSTNSKTHRIAGVLPAEALIPLFGVTLQGEMVNVEVILDIDELRLLKATLEGKITPNEPEGLVRIIRLSDFNEPLSIELPATQ